VSIKASSVAHFSKARAGLMMGRMDFQHSEGNLKKPASQESGIMGLTDSFSFTSYPAFQVLMLSEGSLAVVGGKARSAASIPCTWFASLIPPLMWHILRRGAT
jgi:hypothetical protein